MKKILHTLVGISLLAGTMVSAATVGVDWGGQYSTVVSGLNVGLGGATTATGDYTFDAVSDAAYLLPFGTVYSPSADPRYVAPTGKTGPLYKGLQLVNHSASTAPSEAGLFKWSGSTTPNQLNKTNPTNGGSDPMSLSVAYFAQKADFLNGLDAAGAVGFADEEGGASVSMSVLRNKNNGEATIAFVVQEGAQWYATVATTRAASGSDWSGTLTVNPYTADWYAFDPSLNQFLNVANLGAAKAGSTFEDITAFGISGQIMGYDGTVANKEKLDFTGFSGSFTEILLPSTVASNGYFEHLTDAEIAQIRADLDLQKQLYFERQAGDVLDPRDIIVDWNDRGDFTRYWNQDICTFAMKSFQLEETLAEANAALVEMCQFHLDDPITFYEIHSFPGIFDGLVMMCLKFGPNGTQSSGLMTQITYDKIMETMFEWTKVKSIITDAEKDLSQTWDVLDSENHHAQYWSGCWGFSLLIKDDPIYGSQAYDDGFSPQQHYDAWTAYLTEYLRQRIQKGMLIEINSSHYALATLKSIMGLYDYSDNQTLRQRASDFLDVYWTLWAQSEVDGVCAGAKARCYSFGNEQGTDALFRAAWYQVGIGEAMYEHISMFPYVTTGWTPPDLVFDMLYSPSGRATYESFERRMGLARAPIVWRADGTSQSSLDFDNGGLVRYLWRTPDFTMSSLLFDAIPNDDWTTISSQNRWWGVVFKGHPDARIYPFCHSSGSVYNAAWAVQAQGSMISQELQAASGSDGYRVWFAANGLTVPEESGGWIFAEADSAYAAVKVVGSAYTWDSNANGSWIELTTRYAPVIIEAAPTNEYVSFDAFKSAIQALTPDTSTPGQLHYTGLNGDEFVFYTDQSARNEINGKPIDLAPAATYHSPFIQSSEDGAEITLRCFDKSKTISLGDVPFYDTSATFALWHFNEEDPAGTFPDTSSAAGIEANAVVHSQSAGSVSLIDDGEFGKAIRCDELAGNQYVMTSSSHWPADQGTFRYQGWFRLNAGDAGGYLFHLYDQIYVSVSTTEATFMINKSGVGADTSASNRVAISAALLSTNDWQMIDAFYDGETIRLTTSAETVSEDGLGPFVPNVRSMTVGSRKNANNFVGDMDEVRISIPALQAAVAEPNDPFDSDGDGMPDPWEAEQFGSHRYATPVTDTDGDAWTDLEEYIAGTDPWDPASRFAISALSAESISWQAVEGKTYRVLSTVDLTEEWVIEATGLQGDPPESSYFFSTEPNQQFFKIEVE